MPNRYNLRSAQSDPEISPIRGGQPEDELNTTMIEPQPTVQDQLADVIANLQSLSRIVVENRNEMHLLRQQNSAEIDLLKQQIQRTANANNEYRENHLPSSQPSVDNNGQNSNMRSLRNGSVAGIDCPAGLSSSNNVQCSVADVRYLPNASGADINYQPTNGLPNPNTIRFGDFSGKLYDLPAFSGNADEWPLFIANFKDTTDTFKYGNRQNLMRLQKCLSGPAKEAVSSMLIYPDDVPQVIEELEFRFGRPDILVRSQLRKVKQFPMISHKKMDQIITFSTTVRNVVAFLSSAGCGHHLSSTTLLEEMASKLPTDQQFEWAKEASKIKPFPTIVEFSKWLGDLAKVISLMPNLSSQQNQNQPVKQMMTIDSGKKPKFKPKCEVCKGDHYVSNCKTFTEEMPVKTRWEKVKQLKLCFCCLHKGHGSNTCRYKKVCGINDCKKSHHKTLHEYQAEVEPNALAVLNCNEQHEQGSILFKIMPVNLYGPSGSFRAFVMFDEGSSISLLDGNMARHFGLKGQSSDLTLQWYGEKTVTEKSSKVCLEIKGLEEDSRKFALKNVYTVEKLHLPSQSYFKASFPHLSSMPMEDYDKETPVLLLGLDNAFIGVPTAIIQSQESNIIAMQCKLGWLAYGNSSSYLNQPRVLHIKEDPLHNMVQEFLATEDFGVNYNIEPLLSDDDQVAKQIMEETTKRIGKRFETGLLWKKYPPDMPSSLEMAEKRLMPIERKMIKDSNYGEKYNQEIGKYIQKGYARKLSVDEVSQTSHPVWYLPHFGVVNPHKPDKLRVVFDAAAKTSDISLNSLLLKGPEQAKPLLGILLKFRQGAFGVAADIREMFSQVKIREEDQHAQRFVWRNGKINEPLQHYAMVSMTFGAICSPCCAEYVKNRNASEFSHKYPEAAAAIVEKHYVDDFVSSFKNEEEAIVICQQVVEIHSEGGFDLRGFVSNSEKLEAVMNSTTNITSQKVNMEKQSVSQKILGMYWNKTEDTFEFQTKFHCLAQEVLDGVRVPTKRELLKIAMAVFDPYGLIADFLLYCKLLVQSTWKCQLTWDDPIPLEIHKKWRLWWNEFKNVKLFKVPRCLSFYMFDANIQLHVFVDASQDAFAAVCYFRIQHVNGVDISFIIGKIRCAPLKLMTVPRLELQAAVLGSRLSEIVLKNHEVDIASVHFWSDSQTVLQWIYSTERRFKAFVSHRVAEILNISNPQQWRYVPTHQNPADAGTRAIYPPKFENNSVWITGPKFLREDCNLWPNNHIELSKKPLDEEIKTHLCINNQIPTNLIEYSRFSSYVKLKRTMVWVLRFAKLLPNTSRNVNVKEIDVADKMICKMVQTEQFPDEVSCLKKNTPISKSSSLYTLAPYLDEEGLLRIQGRLDEAQYLPFDARRPIILPNNHWVSELVMSHFHYKNHHQNMNLTINELRQKYWITNIKSLFKKVKRNCYTCKIDSIRPNIPLMGQLPPDRVIPYVRPFTYTGVDLFGPFNVSIGRRREKRWAVIFTCLTIRAAHIELVDDLSTDAFILSFRNFVNRRGTPIRIRSDNGTNFIGAQKLLKKEDRLINVDELQQEATNRNIEWLFNCPANPSSGGVWERLIQIVKRLLTKTLKDSSPKVETLRSLLIEAENIINSRPLTEMPISSADDEPLTPNHFLLGCLNSTQTPSDVDETVCLRKQWKISQNLKDRLWKQWVTQYLPQLIRMSKWRNKTTPIKVDDIVVILDSTMPRSQWLKGRIVKVFPAKDGQIRFAEVKTLNGITRRPVSKLAVLEVESGESG